MSFYTDSIDKHTVHTNLQNALAEIEAVVKVPPMQRVKRANKKKLNVIREKLKWNS